MKHAQYFNIIVFHPAGDNVGLLFFELSRPNFSNYSDHFDLG